MENSIDILDVENKPKKEQQYKYNQLLSDQEIYTILWKAKKLNWWENFHEIFSVLSDIVYNLYTNIKKTPKYDADAIWNLSPRQTLSKWEVFFMNTCLEYSLLTLQYMKQAGFKDTKLVINELSTSYPWFYKLHFGVEWIHENQTYYIDHQRRNTVVLGQGEFVSNYSDVNESVLNTIVIPWNMISIDDTFPELCTNWFITLKYFSPKLLSIFKEKFQKDNTPEEREHWFIKKVVHPNKPEIIIKN